MVRTVTSVAGFSPPRGEHSPGRKRLAGLPASHCVVLSERGPRLKQDTLPHMHCRRSSSQSPRGFVPVALSAEMLFLTCFFFFNAQAGVRGGRARMFHLRTCAAKLRPLTASQTAKTLCPNRPAAARTLGQVRCYSAPVAAEPFLSGTSSNYVEEMYYAWLENPKSVHKVSSQEQGSSCVGRLSWWRLAVQVSACARRTLEKEGRQALPPVLGIRPAWPAAQTRQDPPSLEGRFPLCPPAARAEPRSLE